MSQFGAAADATAKVGRDEPCRCGSGRQFMHCCEGKDSRLGPLVGTVHAPPAAARQREQELFGAAKQHWDAGRWTHSIPLFREIVRLMPNNAQAYYNLGAAYLNCNRLREATACLQRALELRPSFEGALQALASALERAGRTSESSRACRKLGRTADDPVVRRHYVAKAFELEGKLEEAEGEYRCLLAVAPQRAETRLQLGILLSGRGMFDEAAQHLSLAFEGLPARPVWPKIAPSAQALRS